MPLASRSFTSEGSAGHRFPMQNLQPGGKELANHRCQRYPLPLLPRSPLLPLFSALLVACLAKTPFPTRFFLALSTDPFRGRSSYSPRPPRAGPLVGRLQSAGALHRRRGDSPRRTARASPPGPVGQGGVLLSLVSTPHRAACTWPGWARCDVRGRLVAISTVGKGGGGDGMGDVLSRCCPASRAVCPRRSLRSSSCAPRRAASAWPGCARCDAADGWRDRHRGGRSGVAV